MSTGHACACACISCACVSKGTRVCLLCVWHMGRHRATGGSDKEDAGVEWACSGTGPSLSAFLLLCCLFPFNQHALTSQKPGRQVKCILHFSIPPASPGSSLKALFCFSLRKKESFGIEKMEQGFNTTLFFFSLCTCVCLLCVQKTERRSQKRENRQSDRKECKFVFTK